jgi:hypothetical protein
VVTKVEDSKIDVDSEKLEREWWVAIDCGDALSP